MLRYLKLLILVLFSSLLSAQPYGNEWIDYSQKYYQFKITTSGLYRISYQTLVDANIPLSTIDPANFQLFAKGKEQPIHIEGGDDGVFDPTDYIEFYAEHNDGWLDTILYKNSENQPNPYYSLINDTIIYYLSWNTTQNNLRYKEETAVDFNNYFSNPYVWKESLQFFTSNYYDGEIIGAGLTDPEYVPSEGYMDRPINIGQQRKYNIPSTNIYASGPAAKFEFKIAGASNWAPLRDGDHHLAVDVGNMNYDTIFKGYQLIHLDTTISLSSLSNGATAVTVRSIDDLSDRTGRVDRLALAYLKLTYPHNLDLSGLSSFKFMVDNHHSQNKQFVEFTNFNAGSNPVLYDITNHKKITISQGFNSHRVLIPNGTGLKECILSTEAAINSITHLSPVLSNGYFTDYESTLGDNIYMIITHPRLDAATSTYAAYRLSKGYNVEVVNIEELYHQYGFGIEKSPIAIRNFMDIVVHQWSKEVSHLFLLGKSVNAKDHRDNASAYAQNLVPTIGNPPADNMLTAGLGNTFLEPLVPQGRLSARNDIDIKNYLDKVTAYESAPTDLWMKNALHFAGGNSLSETGIYLGYLSRFENLLSSPHYGGDVRTFRKSSAAPYQTSLSDSIRNIINNGVGLMTFFGHASATGDFDITIDSPDKLNNFGKYPVILANSCFSGNSHQPSVLSTGESFVLEKNKGAVGFIANGSLGMPYELSLYSTAFYESISGSHYRDSWAKSMQTAVKKIQGPNINGELKVICLDMILQGDPAIKPPNYDFPDYRIRGENVKVSPIEVTTSLDKFKVSMKIENIGRAVREELAVQLQHTYPGEGNQDTIYTKLVSSIFYDSTLEFMVPIDLFKSPGVNKFTILLDPLNELDELSKMNNRYDFEVNIRSGDLLPIYPPEFSIVGEPSSSLKASTVYTFEKKNEYLFELDTTPDFNSSWKSTTTIESEGGVVEWKPSALAQMQDSMVYYWRVRRAVRSGETPVWHHSSFQYIPQDSGWSQSDYGQYEENEQIFLEANRNNIKFKFTDQIRELYIKTYGSPSVSQATDIQYRVDTDVRERNGCGSTGGFLIAVLDSLTFESWKTPYFGQNNDNYFGQANYDDYCGSNRLRSESYFLFRHNDSSQMLAMRDFIKNEIPQGSYIILYSWFKVNYSDIWNQDSSILKSFEELGSTKISNLPDHYPFILTARKGDISSLVEVAGDSATDVIELTRTLTTSANFGQMLSPKIGPSIKWNRLSYHFDHLESVDGDSITYHLIGSTRKGDKYDILTSSALSLDTSLAFVGDSILNMHMEVRMEDEMHFTPPQMKFWQLNYYPAIDFALAPNLYFKQNKDTLNKGEMLKIKYAVLPIGRDYLDSIKIRYSVLQNGVKEIFSIIQSYPPIYEDSLNIITAEIPTKLLIGDNTLEIMLNPDDDPAEQHRFNNVAHLNFYIITDRLNPIIDVLADGRRIMNGDLISSEPEFVITLKDENNFLAIEDTSSMKVYLRNPDGVEKLVSYQLIEDGFLSFTPAQLPENEAKVIYQPKLKQDGKYQLRIQAKDASGNAAKEDYKVEFEVIQQSTVTHLLNYPNPFSTSTRFVFTLTGNRIPDQIQIQIMTITGKVVREIDQIEIGPLHIGKNITDFAWDGKDKYGDQLANGVYLYRVKMRVNGENIKHRESNVDKYFKQDFGKMYLLR